MAIAVRRKLKPRDAAGVAARLAGMLLPSLLQRLGLLGGGSACKRPGPAPAWGACGWLMLPAAAAIARAAHCGWLRLWASA